MALSTKLEMSPVAAAAGSTNGNQQDEACSPYYAFQDNEPLVRNQESTETTSAWESAEHVEEISLSKYKAAALLVREGEDNEKFSSQPKGIVSTVAYKIIHYPLFNWVVFLVCLAIMGMAFFEQPSLTKSQVADKLEYGLIEITLLLFIGATLILRLLWLRPKAFLSSRAVFIAIIVVVMLADMLVMLIRQERHFRFTRALRPLLLLDSFVVAGVRRVIRQIVRCTKYILDVMLVLFFFIALAALMAHFLFRTINPTYFSTLVKSFVSMLITLTTANHPDVFMESYLENPVAPLFFVVYLLITFYYLSNLLLAVVFAKFKDEDKKKYKKLYIHRRSALLKAFDCIAAGEEKISFQDFLFLMRIYKPHLAEHEVMCVFKDLQVLPMDSLRGLSKEEFEHLYECLGMKWELIHQTGSAVSWFEDKGSIPSWAQDMLEKINHVVSHWSFNTFMSFVVIVNLLFLIFYTTAHSYDDSCSDEQQVCGAESIGGVWGSFVFTLVYMMEISTRLVLAGIRRYFRKRWNWFDFIIVFGSFICLCVEAGILHANQGAPPYWVKYLVLVRPIKFLRLLRLKRSYFYLVKAMIALTYRLLSILILMMCVFYFYAIIGMEVFGREDTTVYPGCCKNASYGVGSYFVSNGTGEMTPNVYWLNNFTSLYSSYITLYEEMVINNWYIQMEGFVSTTSWAARIYFILFWITTTIVVNTGIVYIVDGFELCFLALNKEQVIGNHRIYELKKTVIIDFIEDDIIMLQNAITLLNQSFPKRKNFSLWGFIRCFKRVDTTKLILSMQNFQSRFRGKNTLTNQDLAMLMYNSELQGWIEEQDSLPNIPTELNFHKQSINSLAGSQVWKRAGENFLKKTKAVAAYIFQ